MSGPEGSASLHIDVQPLTIDGVVLITPPVFTDDRGWFSETFTPALEDTLGLGRPFIQDNQAFSRYAGTLRGLHLQRAPHGQSKLVMVLAGAIRDVVVDLRPGSATFCRHVSVDLTADRPQWLLVPAGCLHGYVTKAEATRVQYRVDAPYVPSAERAVRWDDADLAIDWGIEASRARLSPKDAGAASLCDLLAELEQTP